MKYILIIAFFHLNFTSCFSQIDASRILTTSKTFKRINNPLFNKDSLVVINKEVIIDTTLYNYNNKVLEKSLTRYMKSVFYYSTENSDEVYYVKQWNAPIVIYIDKSIPKTYKKIIEKFILNFEGVKNLNISITKNIDNSNYYIKSSSEISGADSYNFANDIDKENFVFNNGKYNLISAGNHQIEGCILEFNPLSKKPKEVIEKNLKQLFFISLGRFFVFRSDNEKTSFLNPLYENQEDINEFDLNILKIHYNHIFDYPVNSNTFLELVKYGK